MKRVLLTGATGAMGSHVLRKLIEDNDGYQIRVLVYNKRKERRLIKKLITKDVEVFYGDITNKDDILRAIKDVDMVLHVAAFVSPQADYYPRLAMKINYGGTKNFIDAIKETNNQDKIKFVFIGSIAQLGDRMPPIHWCRIGDPIKPSIFDYYAVSKVAAERVVIESGLANWVVLRQTGIMGPNVSKIRDAIIFHNCLNNVLEYVSDRDSGVLLSNLWNKDRNQTLKDGFWNHIYNIGGGSKTRIDTYTLVSMVYKRLGFKNISNLVSPKMFATRNFHGAYYLDSDKLNDYLDFRNDDINYFYDSYLSGLGLLVPIIRMINRLPLGQKIQAKIAAMVLRKIASKKHGTLYFIKNNMKTYIKAYWGDKKNWDELPDLMDDFKRYQDYDKIVVLNHGYDETKDPSLLNILDMKEAVLFRGGSLISTDMTVGDWKSQLEIKCGFGHVFKASPKLILEGGHWCPVCDKLHWNYESRAKVDKFFAQVWYPLHKAGEDDVVYKKIIFDE